VPGVRCADPLASARPAQQLFLSALSACLRFCVRPREERAGCYILR
jgi:hypothetical protein